MCMHVCLLTHERTPDNVFLHRVLSFSILLHICVPLSFCAISLSSIPLFLYPPSYPSLSLAYPSIYMVTNVRMRTWHPTKNTSRSDELVPNFANLCTFSDTMQTSLYNHVSIKMSVEYRKSDLRSRIDSSLQSSIFRHLSGSEPREQSETWYKLNPKNGCYLSKNLKVLIV